MTTAQESRDHLDVNRDDLVQVRISKAERKTWETAAKSAGLKLSDWIRRQCNGSEVDPDLVDAVAKKLEERRMLLSQPVPPAPWEHFPQDVRLRYLAEGIAPTEVEVADAYKKYGEATNRQAATRRKPK